MVVVALNRTFTWSLRLRLHALMVQHADTGKKSTLKHVGAYDVQEFTMRLPRNFPKKLFIWSTTINCSLHAVYKRWKQAMRYGVAERYPEDDPMARK